MASDYRRDEWLMQQVARGQRDHVRTLLRRYASPLLTFIQRMIGDPHRAEDLFQEVFLAVWTGRKTYQYPRAFRPWLFGIAMNKCRAEFRRPNPPTVELDEQSDLVPVAGRRSPAEAAIASETATLVARAVAALPPGQRSALVMRIWNGLSYAEIAEATGLAQATVRSHVCHALTAVRKYLEPRMRDS